MGIMYIFGAYTVNISFVWEFSDIANGFMVFPNLIALVLLSPVIHRETKKFLEKHKYRFDLFTRLYIALLRMMPKHTLSRFFGYFARWKPNSGIRMMILKTFTKMYGINLKEAEKPLEEYHSLNSFFIRSLKEKVRPIASGEKTIVSPVDGRILNFGDILEGEFIQVKGIHLKIEEILDQNRFYKKFINGIWMTIYLAPKDYHKIHSPVSGQIISNAYSPGRLLPVNDLAVSTIEKLFSKNERVTTYIDTPYGLTALTKVGATNVGRIKLNYDSSLETNAWLRRKKIKNIKSISKKEKSWLVLKWAPPSFFL